MGIKPPFSNKDTTDFACEQPICNKKETNQEDFSYLTISKSV